MAVTKLRKNESTCCVCHLFSVRRIISKLSESAMRTEARRTGRQARTSCRRETATICPAHTCKWLHDVTIYTCTSYTHLDPLLTRCPCPATANQSGLVTLTFDLLTLKVVPQSRVTSATSVPILVFLGLSVLDLGGPDVRDRRKNVRQTDVRQHHRLMPPPRGAGS